MLVPSSLLILTLLLAVVGKQSVMISSAGLFPAYAGSSSLPPILLGDSVVSTNQTTEKLVSPNGNQHNPTGESARCRVRPLEIRYKSLTPTIGGSLDIRSREFPESVFHIHISLLNLEK